MILDIKQYPSPTLRKRAQEIVAVDEEIKKLGQDMTETMIAKKGVGLAANQVGILKRIIVVQMENGPEVFIDPVIIKRQGTIIMDTEGCLSVPDLWLEIKRVAEIEVRALNLDGESVKIKAKGFVARIFQHEIDHLNGVLIIDRVGFWQGLKARRQLKKYGIR